MHPTILQAFNLRPTNTSPPRNSIRSPSFSLPRWTKIQISPIKTTSYKTQIHSEYPRTIHPLYRKLKLESSRSAKDRASKIPAVVRRPGNSFLIYSFNHRNVHRFELVCCAWKRGYRVIARIAGPGWLTAYGRPWNVSTCTPGRTVRRARHETKW